MKENDFMDKDNFLARWLDDGLSKTELQDFEKSEDYHVYKQVLDGLGKLNTPDYGQDEAYKDFKNASSSIKNKEVKVVKFSVRKYLAIAASVAIIVTVSLFSGKTTYQTGIGQKETIILPDDSEVMINAKSELTYNKLLFGFSRKLNLKGEAYFKVSKGSTFSVITTNGEIAVLGTQFNVISRDNFFETNCYEGKVQVKSSKVLDTLTQGEQIKMVGQNRVNQASQNTDSKPSWVTGVSKFKNTPLKQVLNEFEVQFGVSFDTANLKNLSKLYSGAFNHKKDSIQSALENVFLPLGISYDYNENDSVIKLQQIVIKE